MWSREPGGGGSDTPPYRRRRWFWFWGDPEDVPGSLLSVLCLVVVLSVHPNPSSFRGAGEELAEARQSSLPPAQGMEKVMWLRNNVE